MATRTVKRAYKFRFYPTEQQEQELLRTWGCVRVVYNKALQMRHTAWNQNRQRVTYAQTDRAMTGWKKDPELRFLSEVSSVPLQQCLRHLQAAFVNFFERRAHYPRFKSRKRSKLSLTYSTRGFRFDADGQLRLAKMGSPLDVHYSREFDSGSASTVTVTQDRAGRWFVSVLCESEVESLPTVNRSVGIDLGVKDAVVLSDGRRLNPTDSYDVRRKQRKVEQCQKRVAKKAMGSNNRAKARTKLARATAALADARRDWLHKTTTALVEEFDTLCIEDLNVAGMTSSARGTMENPGRNVSAKAGLNRGITEHSFGEFRSMLEYKTEWYGGTVVAVDRFYPSSKTCSSCGSIKTGLRLHQRAWTCTDCGSRHDRDINAAVNINAAGLAVYASGDGVRPARKPAAMQASAAGSRQ
ncbi:RNA-guided endonuclease InsQ/TnpB family protein [Corynebacterium kalidii]